MKAKRFGLALTFLILPIALRALYFYRGIYFPPAQTPVNYSEFSVISPPLSTAPAISAVTDSSGLRVLFDQAHANQFTLAEIELLRSHLLQRGVKVNELKGGDDFPSALKKTDALVIIAPGDFFPDDELQAIETFVQRGGRLLVIADPTRGFSDYDEDPSRSISIANEVLKPFRISFRDDYVYNLLNNEGNFRNVFSQPAGNSPLMNKISRVVFYASHSIAAPAHPLLTGDENTLSSLDDQGEGLALAALDESGNVLAIGDMTFLTTPYNQVADNFEFVLNISDFLLSGDRIRNFSDFPNLFTHPVAIRLTEGVSLDADLMAVISNLKTNLLREDLPLAILESEKTGFDQIILGIYPPDEDLLPFTESFKIVFGANQAEPGPEPAEGNSPDEEPFFPNDEAEFSPSIFVPEFGKIPKEGFGFFLLQQASDYTTLVILADSQENAVSLLQLLVSGSLEPCLATDFVAVCQQTAVDSSFWLDEDFSLGPNGASPTEDLYDYFEETPAPLEPVGAPIPPALP